MKGTLLKNMKAEMSNSRSDPSRFSLLKNMKAEMSNSRSDPSRFSENGRKEDAERGDAEKLATKEHKERKERGCRKWQMADTNFTNFHEWQMANLAGLTVSFSILRFLLKLKLAS